MPLPFPSLIPFHLVPLPFSSIAFPFIFSTLKNTIDLSSPLLIDVGDNTNKRSNLDWFFDRIVRGKVVPMPGKLQGIDNLTA